MEWKHPGIEAPKRRRKNASLSPRIDTNNFGDGDCKFINVEGGTLVSATLNPQIESEINRVSTPSSRTFGETKRRRKRKQKTEMDPLDEVQERQNMRRATGGLNCHPHRPTRRILENVIADREHYPLGSGSTETARQKRKQTLFSEVARPITTRKVSDRKSERKAPCYSFAHQESSDVVDVDADSEDTARDHSVGSSQSSSIQTAAGSGDERRSPRRSRNEAVFGTSYERTKNKDHISIHEHLNDAVTSPSAASDVAIRPRVALKTKERNECNEDIITDNSSDDDQRKAVVQRKMRKSYGGRSLPLLHQSAVPYHQRQRASIDHDASSSPETQTQGKRYEAPNIQYESTSTDSDNGNSQSVSADTPREIVEICRGVTSRDESFVQQQRDDIRHTKAPSVRTDEQPDITSVLDNCSGTPMNALPHQHRDMQGAQRSSDPRPSRTLLGVRLNLRKHNRNAPSRIQPGASIGSYAKKEDHSFWRKDFQTDYQKETGGIGEKDTEVKTPIARQVAANVMNSAKKIRDKVSGKSRSEQSIESRARRSPRKKGKKNDVIVLDSSSDEEETESKSKATTNQNATNDIFHSPEGQHRIQHREITTVDAVRIAIGKKVFSHDCHLSFRSGEDAALKVVYRNEKADRNPKDDCVIHTIRIHEDGEPAILEIRYYRAESSDEVVSSENDDGEKSFDLSSFIAMRIIPSKHNGLDAFSSAYAQGSAKAKGYRKRFVIVEVRNEEDFTIIMDTMKSNETLKPLLENPSLTPSEAQEYAVVLVDDNKKQRKNQLEKERKQADEKTLLVYPFEASEGVFEIAARGLKEASATAHVEVDHASETENRNCNRQDDFFRRAGSSEFGESESSSASGRKGRGHYLTIRQGDLDRLEPGEFLNDTLIDFWMQWLSRNAAAESCPKVRFFTSHFYTTLGREGPKGVTNWTAKKNIDIFDYKFVFIPINRSLHWSLCILANPGAIMITSGMVDDDASDSSDCERRDPYPCFFFLDSLKAHRMDSVCANVRKWLNSEWRRLKKGESDKPFTKRTMPHFAPKIPYQDNYCDCGVFVCRYAYAVYQQRHLEIKSICGRPQFKDMFESAEFKFGMKDIARLRSEMKTLVQRLSREYLRVEEEKLVEKRIAKAAKPALMQERQVEKRDVPDSAGEQKEGHAEKEPHDEEDIDADTERGDDADGHTDYV